jgi:predicted DNA-binding transcriptional regulator YafY
VEGSPGGDPDAGALRGSAQGRPLVPGGGRPESVRTYRISQILRIRVLEDRFDRPHGFDLATHWRSYLDEFNARRYQGEAVVRLSPRILEQLPDLMEPAVVRAAQNSAGQPGPDGRVQVVIPIESVRHAAGMLLRLGAEAEVLAPAELRALIAETIAVLADTYRYPPIAV